MELERPNKKKGFKCNLTNKMENGWELEDFYRNKKTITSGEELYEHYLLFTKQQRESLLKKMPGMGEVKRETFVNFLVNKHIGICPQSIISTNSKYWLELICNCDSEMGLTLPAPIGEIPHLFFQALGIVRTEKTKIREEDDNGRKKNSHTN